MLMESLKYVGSGFPRSDAMNSHLKLALASPANTFEQTSMRWYLPTRNPPPSQHLSDVLTAQRSVAAPVLRSNEHRLVFLVCARCCGLLHVPAGLLNSAPVFSYSSMFALRPRPIACHSTGRVPHGEPLPAVSGAALHDDAGGKGWETEME